MNDGNNLSVTFLDDSNLMAQFRSGNLSAFHEPEKQDFQQYDHHQNLMNNT